MTQELEFPSISIDAWAQTAPMVFDDEHALDAEAAPCPWGYEMLGAACSLEHIDGRRLVGKLLQWDPARSRCLVSTAPDHVETHLPLPQLRLATLTEVLPPGSSLVAGVWDAQTPEPALQQYRVELVGEMVLAGVALNRVDRPEGLYIARRVSAAGASMRMFMPRRAVLNAEFSRVADLSDALGDHPAAGLQAAAVARFEPVKTADELLRAVEAQTSQPVRRLGDILVTLGLVSAEQLAGALKAVRDDGSLPLGQRLVRMGLVSADHMQRALHFKMGYPCVDLKHFAFDRDLLRTLPYRIAAELEVLPLARTADGRVVIAMDDPGRLVQLKQVRMLFNAPLVAAMPWREPVQRVIPDAYGVGEIGGMGSRWYG